jgi:hypothetical protein
VGPVSRFWEYSLAIGLLVFGVVALLAIPRLYQKWQEWQEDEEAPASEEDILADFEEAHAAGELNDEELRRLQTLLGRPVKPRRHPQAASAPAESPANSPIEGGGPSQGASNASTQLPESPPPDRL